MGFFDTLFSNVTGGSREPQKPSNVELELRRRLTVLAGDEATQDTPLRYFLRWTGQVQGVGFRFTNTNLAQARALWAALAAGSPVHPMPRCRILSCPQGRNFSENGSKFCFTFSSCQYSSINSICSTWKHYTI